MSAEPNTADAPAHDRVRLAVAIAGLLAAYGGIPLLFGDGFWLAVLNYAGIAAIGAIGLNLLTGNAGQVSLGHPFFLAIGAYTAGLLGSDWGLPLPVWLVSAAMLGGLVGAAVGPFALRLRGHYLVIITFALIFIGQHVFNTWTSVTGGVAGRPIEALPTLFLFDATSPRPLGRDQSFFLLIWAVVALVAVLFWNILRTRPGRALQAVRDREATAEVIGVNVAQYKIAAFVLSSATAAVAGALYGSYVRFVSPTEWNLLLSIQYLAMIIVGGIGSIGGSIIGALFVTVLPHLVQSASSFLPFIAANPTDPGVLTVFALNQILFGVLIIAFLVVEPRGLAGIAQRLLQAVQRGR